MNNEPYFTVEVSRPDKEALEAIQEYFKHQDDENEPSLAKLAVQVIDRILFSSSPYDTAANIWIYLPTEKVSFPFGSFLTSKENGELVIAPAGTPREEIVGQVTFEGINTKPYIPEP